MELALMGFCYKTNGGKLSLHLINQNNTPVFHVEVLHVC